MTNVLTENDFELLLRKVEKVYDAHITFAAHSQLYKEYLETIEHTAIKEIRGTGLFIGVELHTAARPYCEALMEKGLLCKETHATVIRFAPPLVISKEELDWAIEHIKAVFNEQ